MHEISVNIVYSIYFPPSPPSYWRSVIWKQRKKVYIKILLFERLVNVL